MPLMSIYRDFLKFLDASASGGDLWANYERLYFVPHKQFLSSYWENCIGLELEDLRERVQSVQLGHYSHFLSLLRSYDLEGVCLSTLEKCSRLLRWVNEPTVYLMVGFFSPDGFVIPVGDKPVVGIGLERYKSFRNLPIILAHESCHYVQHIQSYQSDGCTVGEAMLREGTCIAFSKMVFPDRPLTEHLGMSRGRLNWMRANERLIWQSIKPALNLTGRDTIQQYLYGVPYTPDQAAADGSQTTVCASSSRSALYIGFRMAEEFLNISPGRGTRALLEVTPEDALKAYNV
jgi:hypothetical protein